ncbi:hypothetical protein J6590_028471 [Homalodisca vitripennis]|nr:hypothetical protein J6590_028471 [Homalodisca vitripennis]
METIVCVVGRLASARAGDGRDTVDERSNPITATERSLSRLQVARPAPPSRSRPAPTSRVNFILLEYVMLCMC